MYKHENFTGHVFRKALDLWSNECRTQTVNRKFIGKSINRVYADISFKFF